MNRILFQFTEKCNLRCTHCAYECGPKGRTMSRENTEKVLNNLLAWTGAFEISGGEPFVEREKLFHMLRHIQSHITVLPLAEIAVQTNGFWAREEKDVCNTLEELCRLGVGTVAITSIDKYHREQGLDTSKLEMEYGRMFYNAVREFKEQHKAEMLIYPNLSTGDTETRIMKGRMLERVIIRIVHLGAEGFVVPFGRARNLPEKEVKKRTSCGYSPKTKEDIAITIAADGSVYPCCWKVSPSMGSAIEMPVMEIISNAKQDKVLGALLRGGPKEAAKAMGMYNPKDEFMYRRNPCVMCEEIFRGLR